MEPGTGRPDGSRGVDLWGLQAIGQMRSLPAFSTLCHEGQVTDCFFIVTAGELVIAKRLAGQRTVLASCGPGSLLALMPALDGGPCAVTISALNEATVVVVKRERLLALLEQPGKPDPGVADLLSLLAIRRLRGATNDLAEALLGALQSPARRGRLDAGHLARIQADSYAWQGS